MFRIDVAREHLWTSNKDQSAGERSARLGVLALAAECGNQGLGVRRPETDAARKRLPSAGIERDGRRRLCHAVGFEKPYAGALLEPLADSLRQDGAAGQRHPHGGDIAVSNGHLGERRNGRRHAADDCRVESLNNPPVVLNNARKPQAVRRRDDDVPARRQHRQSRRHRASDVEQRESVDCRVELIEAVNLGKAPRGMDLIAVRQAHELRASGRAAGVKERAYGVAVGRELKVQGTALRRQAFIEANNLATGIALAADDQYPLKRRDTVDNRVGLLPERRIVGCGGNDQYRRLFGDQKIGDGVGIEQEVDRAGDPRDLSASESRRNLGQRGAKEGNGAAGRRYAERAKKIGRTRYLIEQSLVRQRDGALIRIAGRHDRQRRPLGMKPRGRLEQLVEIARGYELIVGRSLERLDVGDCRDGPGKFRRPWCATWHSLPFAAQ